MSMMDGGMRSMGGGGMRGGMSAMGGGGMEDMGHFGTIHGKNIHRIITDTISHNSHPSDITDTISTEYPVDQNSYPHSYPLELSVPLHSYCWQASERSSGASEPVKQLIRCSRPSVCTIFGV